MIRIVMDRFNVCSLRIEAPNQGDSSLGGMLVSGEAWGGRWAGQSGVVIKARKMAVKEMEESKLLVILIVMMNLLEIIIKMKS